MSQFDEMKKELKPDDLHFRCDDNYCTAHKAWEEGFDAGVSAQKELIEEFVGALEFYVYMGNVEEEYTATIGLSVLKKYREYYGGTVADSNENGEKC